MRCAQPTRANWGRSSCSPRLISCSATMRRSSVSGLHQREAIGGQRFGTGVRVTEGVGAVDRFAEQLAGTVHVDAHELATERGKEPNPSSARFGRERVECVLEGCDEDNVGSWPRPIVSPMTVRA